MNYDPELDLIVFDHLVSESKDPSKKFTLIPDGDQEGFRWKDGKWIYVEKLFDYKLTDGHAPREVPIKDDVTGASNEDKLWEQSQKNIERAKAAEEKRKADEEKKKKPVAKPPVKKPQPKQENEY
jgi:hypothetical protein